MLPVATLKVLHSLQSMTNISFPQTTGALTIVTQALPGNGGLTASPSNFHAQTAFSEMHKHEFCRKIEMQPPLMGSFKGNKVKMSLRKSYFSMDPSLSPPHKRTFLPNKVALSPFLRMHISFIVVHTPVAIQNFSHSRMEFGCGQALLRPPNSSTEVSSGMYMEQWE